MQQRYNNYLLTPTPTLQQVTTAGSSTSNVISSSVLTGTSPFSISSTTKVDNLNVDMIDGLHFRINTGILETSANGIDWTAVSMTATDILKKFIKDS